MPVELTGKLFCATEADLALVKRLLPEHVRLSRAEPGCLLFEITENDDPMVWDVRERFVSAEALAAHRARNRASVWGPATAHLARQIVTTEC